MKKLFKASEAGSLLFLIGLIILVGLVNPEFLKPTSLFNCFNDSVVFTLLSVGIAFVILTGDIDVSIGSILGLSAAVGASLLRDGASVFVAIIASLIVGIISGLVNGFGVAYLNIPSLIFTLGTNGVIRGIIYVYTKGAWVENLPAGYTKMANEKIIGQVTLFYAITLLSVIIIDQILKRTRSGGYFRAVGDNMDGAILVGIPVRKTRILAYVFSGIFASIAGLVYASRIGFVTPMAGNGYEMKAIAACVIGGIALTGGEGSILGAAIGAVIMSSISRILVFMGFSSDYDNTITGTMLIVIVVVTTVMQNREIIKNRHQVLMARTISARRDREEQVK